MLENLKKELYHFLNDITKNLKNEEDILYVTERTMKLFDIIIDETNKIMGLKEDKMNAIIKQQEVESQKLEILREKINSIYEDICGEEEFDISCPYCMKEFTINIEDNPNEIKCPECGNIIELDWSENLDNDDNEY